MPLLSSHRLTSQARPSGAGGRPPVLAHSIKMSPTILPATGRSGPRNERFNSGERAAFSTVSQKSGAGTNEAEHLACLLLSHVVDRTVTVGGERGNPSCFSSAWFI